MGNGGRGVWSHQAKIKLSQTTEVKVLGAKQELRHAANVIFESCLLANLF